MDERATIYLDCNASTRTDPRVVAAMRPVLESVYANPSNRDHHPGRDAFAAVEDARARIARAIGARLASEIVLTSGATEANNLVLQGVAMAAGSGAHIVTQSTEHPSVLATVAALERRGWPVTRVGVDHHGLVDPDEVVAAVQPSTALVSIMLANNETGTVQPVAEIVRRLAGRVPVHCDAVQAVRTLPVHVRELGAAALTLSGHKCHGPKGTGALYLRRTRPPLPVEPLQYGGGQEHGLRPGTLNTPGAVGLATAIELCVAERSSEALRQRELITRLEARLRERCGGISRNGDPEHCLAGTLNITIAGVDSPSLMASLPDLAISSGSACSATEAEPSPVLLAMGLSRAEALASVRISVCRFTTGDEIDTAVERIAEEVRRLRGRTTGRPERQ